MKKQSTLTRATNKAADIIYKVTKSLQDKYGKEPPYMTEKGK